MHTCTHIHMNCKTNILWWKQNTHRDFQKSLVLSRETPYETYGSHPNTFKPWMTVDSFSLELPHISLAIQLRSLLIMLVPGKWDKNPSQKRCRIFLGSGWVKITFITWERREQAVTSVLGLNPKGKEVFILPTFLGQATQGVAVVSLTQPKAVSCLIILVCWPPAYIYFLGNS